ncbi:MAG TPA: hypothetical protein VFJ16_11555, partial [Longimicrobium sp.]|nr:hypothetical protein [Longimicrobium sp.]
GASGNRGAPVGGPGSMNAGTGQTASDDPTQAREHIRAAEENRDALAEESRRIQGSAPDDVSTGR